MTVEPNSAVPRIFGELLLAGEDGEVESELGALGALESSTYVTPLEHGDGFPAASVAVALNVVLELSATDIAKPGLAKVAAEPVAAAEPEQSEVV